MAIDERYVTLENCMHEHLYIGDIKGKSIASRDRSSPNNQKIRKIASKLKLAARLHEHSGRLVVWKTYWVHNVEINKKEAFRTLA